MLEGDHRSRLCFERGAACGGVEERGAERIHVAAKILVRSGLELFRGDVVGRAPDRRPLGVGMLLEDGEAEIHDLRVVRIGKKNVAGFHVAMNQALLKSRLQSLRDLDAHLQQLRLSHFALERHQLFQRAFVHEFHRDVENPVIRAGGIDLHHMRMADRCGDRRFLGEALDERWILAVLLTEQLQRDLSIEGLVEREIDRAHAAGAEDLLEFKVIEDPPHTHRRAAVRTVPEGQRLFVGDVDQRPARGAFLNGGFGRVGHEKMHAISRAGGGQAREWKALLNAALRGGEPATASPSRGRFSRWWRPSNVRRRRGRRRSWRAVG